MSSFQVPDLSSSPPSTPNKKPYNGNHQFAFGLSNPSTTPAGPPPSSGGSFTPAGLPPSSVINSSMFGETQNSVKPLSFSQQTSYDTSQYDFNSPKSTMKSGFMRQSSNNGPQNSREGFLSSQANYTETDMDEEEVEDEDEGQIRYRKEDYRQSNRRRPQDYEAADQSEDDDEDMGVSEPGRAAGDLIDLDDQSNSDLLLATPNDLRESGGFGSFSIRAKPSVYGNLAKDAASQMGPPAVNESDTVILRTEALVASLFDEGLRDNNGLYAALQVVSGELATLWEIYDQETEVYDSEEYTSTIGPGARASNFAKANFLAGLILQIYQPQPSKTNSAFFHKPKPLPQVLLEWMDEYHDPNPSQFEEIQAHRPSPASHTLFWDTVLNGLLRGKVIPVMQTLSLAGWKTARAEMDGIHSAGYKGIALANVEKVVASVVQVLSLCPAIKGNWDVNDGEWTLFRLKASQALEDLRIFAEGKNRDSNETVAFSSSRRSDTYSRTAKKAESQVPWDVYQQLQILYSILIGDSKAVMANAQDWVEASLGLLLWWDEGKEDRRLALGLSKSGPRNTFSRESDAEIYLRKLHRAFDVVTNKSSELHVQSTNLVELGLASLLEGDNEAVICMLRAWSGPVSAAVAEIASMAGWLPQAEPQSLINMGSLDQDDLNTLGIDSSPSKADGVKDQTLIAYARSMANRGTLVSQGVTMEGWEIAISVLGRLDSGSRIEDMVEDFLNGFSLNSALTVDKLWILLNHIGMYRHAENAAETYANILAEGSHKYGEALWYYALSHKSQKVKDVLDLLNSYSLLQSTAYPPDAELDDHLKRLISSPKDVLTELAEMDVDAAELLHKNLSGYATLRKFYALRDEEVSRSTGQKSKLGPIARKEEAAAALLAVITSSDDNIRGGLYDEGRGAVVSVDFLLALLGEAMVFVNNPKLTITVSQINILLQAIEDIQTVGPRVYEACNEFLKTVIASGQGLKGSTPQDMLRKSTSNVSGTSSFSLVGSSMLASQFKQSMGSSGVLVRGNVKRGWDWRSSITSTTTSEDVLRILRLGLAKDLAKAWLMEVDNRM